MKTKINQNLVYFKDDIKKIVLLLHLLIFFMFTANYARANDSDLELMQGEITGQVVDAETGEPLPGVNIVIEGTNTGVVTDIDGYYRIEAIRDNVLVFSYVGFLSSRIVVGDQGVINIEMSPDLARLDEVVVIGYGTARRRDITGAISSVNMEDSPVAMAPNINILSSLRGTTPGLNIGAVNTAGGSPQSLLIRGQNSIRASNNPLIVLDGVMFLGSLSDINPADIASVDVLKDASSTAVYGSRAANGVILINTKRGKTEKPTLTYSSSAGVYLWNNKPEIMSLDRYIEKVNHHLGVDNPVDWMYQSERTNYENGIVTNMEDYFSRTGGLHNHQISISGSRENLNYYMSTGYTGQKGVMIGDDYNRISLRGSINTYVTDWMQISADGTYNRSDYSSMGVQPTTISGQILNRGDSFLPLYRGDPEDKLLEKWPMGERTPGTISYAMNPLWITQDNVIDNVDIRDYYRLATFAHIEVPFIDGLSYRLNYVRNTRQFKQERFFYEDYFIDGGYFMDLERYSPEAISGHLGLAQGYVRDRVISDYVVDNIVNYRKRIDSHFLDVTLVATRDAQADRQFQLNGNDFMNNGNTLLGIDGITLAANQINSNRHNEFTNIGYLARLNYTFDNKYHFTSSFRRDGSSVFGSRNKWGNFPSVGLAWTLSEEDFMADNDFINYLKVRTSYGKNGNQGISAYQTLARVTAGGTGGIRYQFGDQPGVSNYGLVISSLGNDLLGWETTTSFNAGFEAALLSERVFMDIDFYFSQTVDQLFVRQIPIMTGFNSIRASMGQVDNRGIELSLRTINLQNSNLTWTSHLTFWQNRNILAELYGDGLDDISNNLFIGKSLGAIYGFEWIGIVQEDDAEYIANTGARPGYAKFKDQTGDGQVTFDDDRTILGYAKENFRLNLSNTLNYKNFELYVHLAGIFGGGDNYYMGSNRSAFMATQGGAVRSVALEKISYWTPENPSNTYPSVFYNQPARFLGLQSRTFVRVQDVVLSYTFRGDWMRNINIEGLRTYFSGQNLYTFTGWDGEPEMGIGAISGNYPIPASITAGFDITF